MNLPHILNEKQYNSSSNPELNKVYTYVYIHVLIMIVKSIIPYPLVGRIHHWVIKNNIVVKLTLFITKV